MSLSHCPQVLQVIASAGTSFKGSCACCGWASDLLRFDRAKALSDAYDHLAGCEDMWAVQPQAS